MLVTMAAHADDPGKFIILRQNERTPYEGVLFDPTATAEILNIKVYAKRECDLKLDHAITKKDIEFQQLRESLLKHSPRNNWLWATAGVIAGASATYGAYKVFNDN